MAKLAISAVVLVASRLLSCYYSILTVGVKTCAGVVGWKLGAFDEKAPAFGGKRGAVGEKVGLLFSHVGELCNLFVQF